MSLIQFMKEKQFSVLLNFFALFVISMILYLYGANVSLIILVTIILLFFFLCSIIVEFYRMKKYYDELMNVFEQLDEKTFIADVVKEPSFYSGQVFYHVLKGATKVMNDRIASLKNTGREYHDYIELWVHEIKTPITALKLILTNSRTKENLPILAEVSKIEGYVEQALFYARSSTLNQDYKIETFTLESIVNQAVKSLSLSIIRANGKIETDYLDLNVTTDSKWIVFILKQIIDNSIKYRNEVLQISFSARKIENGTVLKISDNGIGIIDSDIDRIFNRGFTGTNGRDYAKSTGMGLYLCKTLCEKLGLLIKAESPDKRGTTIKIFFPDKLNILN
ncbi:histidine kinase [Bacillus sp. UMB0899]|nr:histidine kinase [Bacillus sp. UMB0899]